MSLLEATYGGRASKQEVDALGCTTRRQSDRGSSRARYRVKQWMRDHKRVPFEVAPEDPIIDRAPLPLYESGHMATDQEEANFEQWMISDLDLCKDIAEFAHFSIALRGGLPSEAEFERAQSRPANVGPSSSANPGCLGRLFGQG